MANAVPLSARLLEQDGKLRVVVCGDVDLATAPVLSNAIDDALTRARDWVVVVWPQRRSSTPAGSACWSSR